MTRDANVATVMFTCVHKGLVPVTYCVDTVVTMCNTVLFERVAKMALLQARLCLCKARMRLGMDTSRTALVSCECKHGTDVRICLTGPDVEL